MEEDVVAPEDGEDEGERSPQLSKAPARAAADHLAFSGLSKQLAAAQANSLASIAAKAAADYSAFSGLSKIVADHNKALGDLSKQIVAAQTTSLASIAAKAAADYSAFSGLSKIDAVRLSSLSGPSKIVADHNKALADLRKQIVAAQTTSLASIAAKIVSEHPAFSGLDEQLDGLRKSVLSELTLRASEIAGAASVPSVVAESARRYGAWNSMAKQSIEALSVALSGQTDATRGALAATAVASLRGLDRHTPGAVRLAQFAATSHLAEKALGAGALTTWRAALESDRRITLSRGLAPPSAALGQLSELAKRQVDLTAWAVQQDLDHPLLTKLSGRPALAWRDRVAQSFPDGGEEATGAVLVAGQATLGLVGGDLLTSVSADDDLSEEVTERVEDRVLTPWQKARLDVFSDLYAALASLDPTVPDLLDGAWDDLHRAGPAAAVKAANCVIEVVDRTFRAAAPDERVREWHSAQRRPASEWEGQPRPPHALRAKYLARNLGDDRVLVEAQAEAFAAMSRRIRGPVQRIKHASQGDISRVKALLLSAEYLLVALFLTGEQADDQ
ncbi:hypothetical protein [Peterkaempfera bronchialis]|uniref:hypothetical protein n=1 Tax=Peterkaempfera bronchialis TaxID=2126346 RepID=UPI003C2CF5E5